MHHGAAGDVRLELQGNDLVITGKQAMTGKLWHCLVIWKLIMDRLSW